MSYLKIVLRHFIHKKLFTLINIFGLGVGLAGVLLLALYVQDEWAIDKQHPQLEDKYRIETTLTAGDEVLRIDGSLPPVAPLLKANFPEIFATTRFATERVHVSVNGEDEGFYEDNVAFADTNIGSFFHFEWLRGEPGTALTKPESIVLTPDFASKYFGGEDPMGRIVILDGATSLEVTGIIADTATSSHFNVDALVPMEVVKNVRRNNYLENWFGLGVATYVQLLPGTDMNSLWPAMHSLVQENMPMEARQIFDPGFRPLRNIHLNLRAHPATQRTRLDEVYLLISISLAILLIACINFVNLATARSSERQKEIAIRKVAGSGQLPIFLQHIAESILMVMLAMLFAIGLAELSLPVINGFTGKQMALAGGNFWSIGLILGLAVAVLAGLYPALFLSRFRPMQVLRQKQRETAGLLAFRNLLVIFQFSIAIIAIVASIVMIQQLQFAKTRETGFDSADVLVIENKPGEQWQTFKQAVRSGTETQQISAALSRPFRSIATSARVRYEGGDPSGINLSQFPVDFGYFELFDVELLAGRYLSESYGTDRQRFPDESDQHPAFSVMLNKAMVDRIGWTPETAVGKRFEVNVGLETGFGRSTVGTVVGVIDDMYVDSVQREVVPQFYFVPASSDLLDYLFLKLNPGNTDEQLAGIETIWRESYPGTQMNAYMLESKFSELYQREDKQLTLLGAFAGLAVFISCIGLIGLATYATQQRVKEVGIRKTIGASVWQIVLLFSADFSKLVLISNLIAWPIAYIAMSRWLEQFAYRIDLAPVIFIGSGLIALCIAWVTVGGTAAKAASAKPVLALRYE